MAKRAYVVGIAGGTGAGKTSLARALLRRVGDRNAVLLTCDAYYRDPGNRSAHERASMNYDRPEALETEFLIRQLEALATGESVQVPIYDFTRHRRSPDTLPLKPAPLVILEGILALADPELRTLLDLRIFVDAPADLRFIRRLQRDTSERGRTIESVIEQYLKTVRPAHDACVEPSRAHADLIVPGTGDPAVAVDLIAAHLGATARKYTED